MASKPSTLRQLANLPSTPAPLCQSVVIVIDAQKEYTQGILPLEDIENSVEKLSQFLN